MSRRRIGAVAMLLVSLAAGVLAPGAPAAGQPPGPAVEQHAGGVGPRAVAARRARLAQVRAIAIGRELRVSGTVTGVAARERSRWRIRVQQRVHARWVTRRVARLRTVLRRGAFMVVASVDGRGGRAARAAAADAPAVLVTLTGPGGKRAVSGPVTVTAVRAVPVGQPCLPVEFFGVRGSGETAADAHGYGDTVFAVLAHLTSLAAAVDARPIGYQAIRVVWWDPRYYGYRYQNSVDTGIASLTANIRGLRHCKDRTRLYLAGYSQGAQVVGDTYQFALTDDERDLVSKMVLLGDPKFVPQPRLGVDVGDFDPRFWGVATTPSAKSRHVWGREDVSKVRSYCALGDPVCNFTDFIQAAACKFGCPHSQYATLRPPGSGVSYTDAAAAFLYGAGPGSTSVLPAAPPPPPAGATPDAPASGTITEFPLPLAGSNPDRIAAGPDGNLWFSESMAGRIARLTPAGELTEFPVADPHPLGVTAGPDGNVWFTESDTGRIGRVTPAGEITDFGPLTGGDPAWITAGPDGNLWFSEFSANRVGRITPAGAITEFILPQGTSGPNAITAGPDGNVWFAEAYVAKIARITPAGEITQFDLRPGFAPQGIAAGPDGNLWFTAGAGNVIGRITPQGTVMEFPLPQRESGPNGIAAGPDGNLWFTESSGNRVGRITTAGTITEYQLPQQQSLPATITAGPDGNLWFTERDPARIARIVP